MGRTADADALIEKAFYLPGADVVSVNQFGMRLLRKGEKEKAMHVFEFNAQQHPEEKFYTHAGLARGYTAMGEKQKAVKHWETALANVPDDQKSNTPVYEKALKDLKDGK